MKDKLVNQDTVKYYKLTDQEIDQMAAEYASSVINPDSNEGTDRWARLYEEEILRLCELRHLGKQKLSDDEIEFNAINRTESKFNLRPKERIKEWDNFYKDRRDFLIKMRSRTSNLLN